MIFYRIPRDPDAAALPLSSSYRDTLRPLCELLDKKGTKLPPDVEQKRETIRKLCSKLAADDAVSNAWYGPSSSTAEGLRKWVFPLCAFAGVCYWGYQNRNSVGARAPVTAGAGDISKAREARLKRFKES